MNKPKNPLAEGTHKKLIALNVGEHFYSDLPAQKFTYIKNRYGITLKTERFTCVNEKTLNAMKITKVTRIK